MKPLSCLIAAFAVASAAVPPLAAAEPVTLTDAELDGQRGGLQTPLGFDVGFGASVKTFVDGTLALETRINWTENGPQSEQIVNELGSITGAPIRIGTLNGAPLASVPGGSTTVVHDLTMDRIASLIVNTADNRTIRQETDITLVLPQLAELQQRVAADRLSSALSTSVGLALRTRPPPGESREPHPFRREETARRPSPARADIFLQPGRFRGSKRRRLLVDLGGPFARRRGLSFPFWQGGRGDGARMASCRVRRGGDPRAGDDKCLRVSGTPCWR